MQKLAEKTKKITIIISQEQYDWLENQAQKRGISHYIRELLREDQVEQTKIKDLFQGLQKK